MNKAGLDNSERISSRVEIAWQDIDGVATHRLECCQLHVWNTCSVWPQGTIYTKLSRRVATRHTWHQTSWVNSAAAHSDISRAVGIDSRCRQVVILIAATFVF